MGKNALLAVLACFCAGALFAACALLAACSYSPAALRSDAMLVLRVEGAELIETAWGEQDPAAAVAARGANDFAFRLGAALAGNIGNENFVASPYSVWMPLAALLNATREQHRPALLEALGAGGIGPDDVNRAASRMLFDLTNERARRHGWGEGLEESPLRIANAIFVDRRFTLRRDFAQTFMDFYRGELISVDFLSPEAVAAVNRWASENTDGLIEEVVREFDPDTAAAIANAIYFSDGWMHEFNPRETERDTFYSPAGESPAYFMRLERRDFLYFEDERIQAVDLPFVTGGGMKIILPRNGDAAGFLSAMTSAEFDRLQRDSAQAQGTLLLPRFSVESTIDNLKTALVALGVPLFDEAAAPLTGGLIEEGLPVWLSDAVQVAMIEVDEEGATAAAVTVMMAQAAGMPPPPEVVFEMVCNSPFVFVLHRHTHDGGRQVLFTGVVNQP